MYLNWEAKYVYSFWYFNSIWISAVAEAEAFALQIFVATWRKTLTSHYLTNQLSNVNNSFNFGKRHHSASSIVARVKSWKSDMVFYEHLNIKKMPVFETVWTENNPFPVMFHLQQMKEKQRKKSEGSCSFKMNEGQKFPISL